MDINELWKGGVIFVILVGFAWGVWRAVQWVGENVAKPLVTNQIEFTRQVAESNRVNAESNRVNAKASADMADSVKKLFDSQAVVCRLSAEHPYHPAPPTPNPQSRRRMEPQGEPT